MMKQTARQRCGDLGCIALEPAEMRSAVLGPTEDKQ
jgi:hypothetical protein